MSGILHWNDIGGIGGTPGSVNAGPWTPAGLPGLRGWWVPDVLRQAEGSPVLSLPSRSGPYNTMTVPEWASAPTYTTINGKGSLLFAGANDSLVMSDKLVSSGAPAITFFALLKHDAISTGTSAPFIMGAMSNTPNSTRAIFLIHSTAGPLKAWRTSVKDTDSSAVQSVISTTDADLLTHVGICIMNRAPAGNLRTEIWLDGVNILTDDRAFTMPTWPIDETVGGFIGCRSAGTSCIIGKMINFGVTHSAPSTLDRQKLEGHLAHFGGISGQLPPAHPYFSSPP
jgi:hypothetical protein